MAKYSNKSRDVVPDKHSDNAQRRTRPADVPALSVKAINNLYAKNRLRPNMRADDHEAPQELGDRNNLRAPNYHNDVPLTGERSWLRGGGRGGEDNPCFDTGKLDVANKPPRPPKGLEASGADCTRSPFSAAYRKGLGEGF
jgi:hypothetical protein